MFLIHKTCISDNTNICKIDLHVTFLLLLDQNNVLLSFKKVNGEIFTYMYSTELFYNVNIRVLPNTLIVPVIAGYIVLWSMWGFFPEVLTPPQTSCWPAWHSAPTGCGRRPGGWALSCWSPPTGGPPTQNSDNRYTPLSLVQIHTSVISKNMYVQIHICVSGIIKQTKRYTSPK